MTTNAPPCACTVLSHPWLSISYMTQAAACHVSSSKQLTPGCVMVEALSVVQQHVGVQRQQQLAGAVGCTH